MSAFVNAGVCQWLSPNGYNSISTANRSPNSTHSSTVWMKLSAVCSEGGGASSSSAGGQIKGQALAFHQFGLDQTQGRAEQPGL